MSKYTDNLKIMVQDAPQQVENIESSIAQVQDQIDDLQEEDDAIKNAVLDTAASELADYLTNVKAPSLGNTYVSFGGSYNVIGYGNQLTDWSIKDATSNNNVYVYGGVGWDGDLNIVQWVQDWAFGNDYLTRPLTSGATYGIRPYKSNLNSAKALLQQNSNKVANSIDTFNRYIP